MTETTETKTPAETAGDLGTETPPETGAETPPETGDDGIIKPVELDTPETPAETAGDLGTETPAETAGDGETKELTPEEKRLDKIERRQHYLDRQLRRGNRAPEKKEPLKPKPQEDDFETRGDFIEALTDWKVDEREEASTEKALEQSAQDSVDDFYSVIDRGVDKYPDFNEVARKKPADGGPEVNGAMIEAMSECDNPVDVAYWLGQNPAESLQISRMGDIQAARAIGSLDAGFSNESGGLPQKTNTKPVKPMKTVDGTTVTDKNLAEMPMKTFVQSRNKRDGVA